MSNASSAANDTKRSTQSSLAAAMLASDLGNPPLPESPAAEGPDEYNDIGIPVVLLWLPYTTLSIVLIGLMVVSFIRFHFKHGHKYRRRREQFWRELNVQDILREGPTDRPRLPRPTDRIDRLIQDSNVQPQPAWNEPVQSGDIYRVTEHPPQPQGVATDSRSYSSRQQQMATHDSSRRPKMSLAEAESSLRRSRSFLDHFRSSVCYRKQTRNRLPVSFNSNLNGSMVNIRCGEKESLSTFQTSRGLDPRSIQGPRQPNCDGQSNRDGLPNRDGQSHRHGLPNRDGQLIRDGQSNREGQPNRDGLLNRDGQPIRDGQLNRDGQPNRDGHAQRRPEIWTVQSGYKPKLLSAVSGTFGSSNSAVAVDELSLLRQTPL